MPLFHLSRQLWGISRMTVCWEGLSAETTGFFAARGSRSCLLSNRLESAEKVRFRLFSVRNEHYVLWDLAQLGE